MYTLYYLNRNHQLGTITATSLDAPLLIPEDLVFSNLRKGINFIKEPHQCIAFTDIERLIISSEFTDSSLVKEADFRRANSYLTPLCPIDVVPLVLDLVTYSFLIWNYPTIVDVQRSVDNVSFSVVSSDKLSGASNDHGSDDGFFRLHDKQRNIYSNVIQYFGQA